MSLYSAFLGARKRRQERAVPAEPAPELEIDPDALPVFDLLPPDTAEEAPPPEGPTRQEEPRPPGRAVHTIGISDLTRLAIDNDGRLYWDGKPVEVSRRIMMSRRQILGASLIAAFVVIGALGAAIQGAAAARDWACRLGWSSKYCAPAQNSSDIPA
jgi:hypothetical protein